MITLVTTFTPGGAANIGDLLIEESLAELLGHIGIDEPVTSVFREAPLDDRLDEINASRLILLPGFAIRDTPMWPVTYRLTRDLDAIEPPLVPVGANYNVYPGDEVSLRSTRYSEETLRFLRHVAGAAGSISCREWHTCEILERHAIGPTIMTGDPAWYHLPSIGTALSTPSSIESLVFTPPLSAFYRDQAIELLTMLAETFPGARRFCALHLKDRSTPGAKESDTGTSAAVTAPVAEKNAAVVAAARERGFDILVSDGTTELLERYRSCDLHVGYECHAHLAFLRERRPSVMIHEDARGVGYSYTLGGAGFDGFLRNRGEEALEAGVAERKRITSGYATTEREISIAPPRPGLAGIVGRYLAEELASDWRRVRGIADVIDATFERAMVPFLESVCVNRVTRSK